MNDLKKNTKGKKHFKIKKKKKKQFINLNSQSQNIHILDTKLKQLSLKFFNLEENDNNFRYFFHKPDQNFGWHQTEAFPLGSNIEHTSHLWDACMYAGHIWVQRQLHLWTSMDNKSPLSMRK